jgi:hypothetical protein
MSTTTQKKGPAEAATSPDRGSTNPRREKDMNEHSNTTAATGAATPIMKLARQLSEAVALYDKAEQLETAAKKRSLTSSEGVSFLAIGGEAAKHFYDEELMVRAAIGMHKAECLEDAAVQIAEALIHFDMLCDQIPSNAETFQMQQDRRAILRLLYSAFDFIDGAASDKLAATLGSRYVSPGLNPWYGKDEVRRHEVPA